MEQTNQLPHMLLRDALLVGAQIDASWQGQPDAPSLTDVVFAIDAANQLPLPQLTLAMYWLGLKHGAAVAACTHLEEQHPWLASLGALPEPVMQRPALMPA